MEPSLSYRPRVSRETRLLLTAGLLALAALWLLSRFRFQERPPSPNPVPIVLSQLARVPVYDDLAAEVARVRSRVGPSLLAFDLPPALTDSPAPRRVGALRLRDDLAVALLPGEARQALTDPRVVAGDPASGLLVVRTTGSTSGPPSVPWVPSRLQQPRYLIASDMSPRGLSLQPVFVGSLDPIDSPWWPEPIWAVPARDELRPGSFVFTNNGELVGLVFAADADVFIVPAEMALAEAERLLSAPRGPAGTLGIEVQTLTAAVASATGSSVGVVVSWVAPVSAAKGQVRVGDVIEAVDGRPMATRQHWDVRVARMSAGERLRLLVRRAGEVGEIDVLAAAVAAPASTRSLGLTLRGRTGVGAEVLRVARGSAADRAGLAPGDVITLIGDEPAPTPARITRSFASLGEGQRALIAVTRGDTHRVLTLEP